MTSPVHKAQHIILHHFAGETDATGAKNASFVIQNNSLPQIHILRLLDLVFNKTTGPRSVFDRVLLQFALTRLITNRTVQRMIDQ